MKIQYQSSRREVAAWYWRSLRRNPKHRASWLLNLALVGALAALLARAYAAASVAQAVAVAAGATVLWAAALALYPQLVFKPQVRVLDTSPRGIATTIGDRSKSIGWAEVADVSADRELVCIVMKSMNALLIPGRAFGTPAEREVFVRECQEWLAAARARSVDAATP